MIRLACQGSTFRRQWLALSLALAACDCVRAEWQRTPAHARELPGLEDGQDLERVIGRVEVARLRCARRFMDASGAVPIEPLQQRAMDKRVRRIGREIHAAWPGSEVPARAWLTATLLVVEDVAAQVPPRPLERRVEWQELVERLLELYQVYDPSLDAAEAEAGQRVGERVRAIVFG